MLTWEEEMVSPGDLENRARRELQRLDHHQEVGVPPAAHQILGAQIWGQAAIQSLIRAFGIFVWFCFYMKYEQYKECSYW